MNRTAAYYQNYFDANFFEYEMMDDDDGYWHFLYNLILIRNYI